MPRVTIDTTEATSFEAVEPGPYPMTVGTIEIKKSKDSGQSMMNVGFKFEDPSTAKKAGTVFRNYMLEGKGAGFSRDFLKVFGIDIPIGARVDFDSDEIVGKHVVVQIDNKEYNGQIQNDIARVIPA